MDQSYKWQFEWVSLFLLLLFCFSWWILHVIVGLDLCWGEVKENLYNKQQGMLVLCGCPSQVGGPKVRSQAGSRYMTSSGTWLNKCCGPSGLISVCPGLSCNGIGVALGPIFHLSEKEFSSKYCTRRSWSRNQSSDFWTCWSLKSLLANTAEGWGRIVSASLQHRCGEKDHACCFLLKELCDAVSITGTYYHVWIGIYWQVSEFL